MVTENKESDMPKMDIIEGELCPMCNKNTLTLTETEREIPYFGKAYLFSMTCSNCKYHKADVETESKNDPSRYTIEIESEEDLNIRVVKSAGATIKIPHMITVESAESSNGYVTNIEGILNRIKKVIEMAKEDAEEETERKKAKNMLKKLTKVMWGQEKLKLIIEDTGGNSAIISDKAVKTKL